MSATVQLSRWGWISNLLIAFCGRWGGSTFSENWTNSGKNWPKSQPCLISLRLNAQLWDKSLLRDLLVQLRLP